MLYLMALRPLTGNRAVFLDPLLLRGTETKLGWQMALGTIPIICRTRIKAFVVDNFSGCTSIAKDNGWVLQLCHFHLIAHLKSMLGGVRRRSLQDGPLRKEAFRLVRIALATADSGLLGSSLDRLEAIHGERILQWKFKDRLREFIRRIDAYRAYRNHPELGLPRTTGSAESMVRVVSDLMRRTRGISSPDAYKLWVTNYIRARPEITCNPA